MLIKSISTLVCSINECPGLTSNEGFFYFDIAESFKLGVAGYMVKPISYKEFVKTVKIIDMYWTLSELPNENREIAKRQVLAKSPT